jgi:ribosome biogenesis GTPase / thiamine phosphate phosphatase
MEGLVIKSTGSWYSVKSVSGEYYECKLKGNFRIKGIKSTNPIAVGDKVSFEFSDKREIGLITAIHDRSNYIVRKSTNLSKQIHIIAANLDQAVIIVTLAEPRTSTGFIDRFLVTTEGYHIPAVLVFNKTDIYNDEQMEYLNELEELYEHLGYPCISTSATENVNTSAFQDILKNKVSLIVGHSGVGKSTLINAIEPRLHIRVGKISDYHKKGQHTTTVAEMHELSGGAFIIDTPGIKEYGIVFFTPAELAGYFPEMRSLLPQCRFYNCTHVHEPGCAVIEALEKGEVALSRYTNYLGMLDDKGIDKNQEWS